MDNRAHWDEIYQRRGEAAVSWYQPQPGPSLDIIASTGIEPGAAIIDVGAGASRLVDRLLEAGYGDITVLDISGSALEISRQRLRSRSLETEGKVTWVATDWSSWSPSRSYQVWHDRALFHFLTEAPARERYIELVRDILAPRGWVLLATFAPAGPQSCSGLPVTRYDAPAIAALFGADFSLKAWREEVHLTPAGLPQPFTWVSLQRV